MKVKEMSSSRRQLRKAARKAKKAFRGNISREVLSDLRIARLVAASKRSQDKVGGRLAK